MNLLNEVLINKTNKEIVELYHLFKERNNLIEASKLRAGFILKEYFSTTDFSEELKYLIEEESKDIENKYEKESALQWGQELLVDSIREYSTINTLIRMKIMETTSDLDTLQLQMKLRNKQVFEMSTMSTNSIKSLFLHTLRETLLVDEDFIRGHGSLSFLLEKSHKEVPLLKSLYYTHMVSENFDEYYERVEQAYNELEEGANFDSEEMTELREALLILMVVYLSEDQILEANILLMRALHITPNKNDLYWTLKFLEKEFRDRLSLLEE